ncbi:MAG: SPOR domain-containing protein [Prolixibacteraceae bacterium]|nr:SPOR domain-containing protein [Prolixibacteraceae bacterium]
MKRFFLCVVILMAGNVTFAQDFFSEQDTIENKRPEIIDQLTVIQDPRLEKMLAWDIEKNRTVNGIEGYRVEIFFSPGSDAYEMAKKKKLEFLSKNPDIPVYIKYDAPNFRVRVGDFRTKNEALKLYQKIKKDYPVAFIASGKINFPLLK